MKVDIKIPLMVLMLSIIIVLLISILPKDIGNEQKMLIKSSNLEISELLLIKKIGSFGSEAGEFDGPTGLEFFNNKLFVLDSGNNRIQIFSEGLDLISIINLPKVQKNLPQEIALTSDKIFVVYTYDYIVKVFDYNGNFLSQFPVSWTTDLEADDNFIYVMEPLVGSIIAYDHQGMIKKQFEAHKNVHYINSDEKNLIVSGPHHSVNIPPEILVYEKDSGVIKKQFPTSEFVFGSAIIDDMILFLESDTIKIIDFDGKLVFEYDLEQDMENVRHTRIEINKDTIFVPDVQDNSIKILKIIHK